MTAIFQHVTDYNKSLQGQTSIVMYSGKQSALWCWIVLTCLCGTLWYTVWRAETSIKFPDPFSYHHSNQYLSSANDSGSLDNTEVPKTLGVEQIEADFPGTYKNPNNWFNQQPTPIAEQQEALLSHDQKAFVSHFDFAVKETQSRVQKIISLWNVHNTQRTWNDHIQSLDGDVCIVLKSESQLNLQNK